MDAEIAKLVEPTPVPEPAGKPQAVENPDNEATLDAIASKYSTRTATVSWRWTNGKVEFYRSSGWSGNGYKDAQEEYRNLKAEYDEYLKAFEAWADSNPEYAAYLKAKEESGIHRGIRNQRRTAPCYRHGLKIGRYAQKHV